MHVLVPDRIISVVIFFLNVKRIKKAPMVWLPLSFFYLSVTLWDAEDTNSEHSTLHLPLIRQNLFSRGNLAMPQCRKNDHVTR